MPSLSYAELFAALQVEGGAVNVFKSGRREHYHVFFRYKGRQVNRSCGTSDYAHAKERAAAIFNEVVSSPEKQDEQSKLDAILARLDSLTLAASQPRKIVNKDLTKAVEEFIKEKQKRSPFYVERLARRLHKFEKWANERGLRLSLISAIEIKEWLDSLELKANRSETNELNSISCFFRWCAEPERAWIASDPCKGMSRRSTDSSVKAYPKICHVSDVASLFQYLEDEQPDFVIYFALAFFGGARKQEITRAFVDVGGVGADKWAKTDAYRSAEGLFHIKFPKVRLRPSSYLPSRVTSSLSSQ